MLTNDAHALLSLSLLRARSLPLILSHVSTKNRRTRAFFALAVARSLSLSLVRSLTLTRSFFLLALSRALFFSLAIFLSLFLSLNHSLSVFNSTD